MVTTAEKKRRRRAQAQQPRTRLDACYKEPRCLPEHRASAITDGWLHLIRKQRVSAKQIAQGHLWRRLYRDVGETPPMRSCLNIQEGHGQAASTLPTLAEHTADAKLQMAAMRDHIADTTPDHADEMLHLLDAVCGRGMTLLELHGSNSRKADGAEKTMKIALDMLSARGLRRAA